jgi:hypothetical protein
MTNGQWLVTDRCSPFSATCGIWCFRLCGFLALHGRHGDGYALKLAQLGFGFMPLRVGFRNRRAYGDSYGTARVVEVADGGQLQRERIAPLRVKMWVRLCDHSHHWPEFLQACQRAVMIARAALDDRQLCARIHECEAVNIFCTAHRFGVQVGGLRPIALQPRTVASVCTARGASRVASIAAAVSSNPARFITSAP